MGDRLERVVGALDDFQRDRSWVGFPLAVLKKFGDDRAGNLAALIAYYGFFSLFPLLLALVTILGFVLSGHPGVQHDIVNSALARFPVIGPQLRRNVHGLQGSTIALVVGLAGLVWAGMAAIQAGQTAMNTVWRVPIKQWPNALHARLRALGMLGVLGGGTLLSTLVAGTSTFSGSLGIAARIGGVVLSVALNVGLFLVAFRLLPSNKPRWADLLPGALVAGIAWSILQSVGTYVVDHQLRGASEAYGTFAVVIGLLSWLYLQAQITLFAAEVNVVRVWRLWPRGLSSGRLTNADRRALEQYARIEERTEPERVDVEIENGQSHDVSGTRR